MTGLSSLARCGAIPKRMVLTLVLVIASCGGGDETEWEGSIEIVGGVPVVRNPSEPLHSEGTVDLTAVWSQSGLSRGPIWEEPHDVAIGDAVFVLDRMAHQIYRLNSATGTREAQFGREGSGPGELSNPAALVVIDGEPVILDSRSLKRFGSDGEAQGQMRFNAILFGIYSLGDSSILATAMGTGSELSIVVEDSLTGVPVPEVRAEVDTHFDQCRRYGVLDTLIARTSCVRPFVQLFDRHGTPVREVFIEGEAQERSDAEVEEYIAQVRRSLLEAGQPASSIDALVAAQREDLRLRRAWGEVRSDPSTGIMVMLEQESGDFGGGPATLHIFDSEGVYLAVVRQTEAWWDFAFVDGDIVALVRAPNTGLVTVVRYRVSGLAV